MVTRLTLEQIDKLREWLIEHDYELYVNAMSYRTAAVDASSTLRFTVNAAQLRRQVGEDKEGQPVTARYKGYGGPLRKEITCYTSKKWTRLMNRLVNFVEPGKRLLEVARDMKKAKLNFSVDAIKQVVHNHRLHYKLDWDDPKAEDPKLVPFPPATAERKG